jgi:DNA repair exonuclease SbcCD ATPase subunit
MLIRLVKELKGEPKEEISIQPILEEYSKKVDKLAETIKAKEIESLQNQIRSLEEKFKAKPEDEENKKLREEIEELKEALLKKEQQLLEDKVRSLESQIRTLESVKSMEGQWNEMRLIAEGVRDFTGLLKEKGVTWEKILEKIPEMLSALHGAVPQGQAPPQARVGLLEILRQRGLTVPE